MTTEKASLVKSYIVMESILIGLIILWSLNYFITPHVVDN